MPFAERDGRRLWYRALGRRDAPAVLMLHGFFGSHSTWLPFVREQRATSRFILPDLYGHGRSPAAPGIHMSPDGVAGDLLALMSQLGHERFRLVGYSMGGRIALRMAIQAPTRIERLMLVSASPGIPDADERRQRRHADEQLAQMIRTRGLAAFAAKWDLTPVLASAGPLSASARSQLAHERRRHTPDGIAASLVYTGAGCQADGWPALDCLAVPTLLVAGERDEKYTATTRAMAERLPVRSAVIVPGVGHRVQVEAPERFLALIVKFLAAPPGEKCPTLPAR